MSDISVGEILDTYKNDTDLLKHILAAKTEEDKVSSCLWYRSLIKPLTHAAATSSRGDSQSRGSKIAV